MLDALDDFLAVHRCGGIGRAAVFLGITQSALTRRLQKAESDLGVKLIEKSGRGIRFTPAGQAMLKYAQGVQSQWSSMRDHLRDLGSQIIAPYRVVTNMSAMHELDTWFLSHLTSTSCWIQVMSPHRCWQSIQEGTADESWTLIPKANVADLSRLYPACESEIVSEDYLSPFIKGPTATHERSYGLSLPLVLYIPGTLFGDAIRALLKTTKLDLADQIRAEVPNVELMAHCIRRGMGVGWLPERYQAHHDGTKKCMSGGDKRWRIPLALIRSRPKEVR